MIPAQIGWLAVTLILAGATIVTQSAPCGLAAITMAIIFHAVVTQ